MDREDNGLGSRGMPLQQKWPELCVGLLEIQDMHQRPVSEIEAMRRCVGTSADYAQWPDQSREAVSKVEQSAEEHNLAILGYFAENHSLLLHAIAETARAQIVYTYSKTVEARYKVWELRKRGLGVFFVQGADAHLKVLFLEKDLDAVMEQFPELIVIRPAV